MSWWQRLKGSPIFGIVLIVIIIFAVYFAYRRTYKRGTELKERLDIVICAECKHIFRVMHNVSENGPFKCENCENKTAYIALECLKCGEIYPMTEPFLVDNVCPRCGENRSRLLPYFPGLEEEEKK